MKQQSSGTKPTYHLKANIKPPARIPVVNITKKTNDSVYTAPMSAKRESLEYGNDKNSSIEMVQKGQQKKPSIDLSKANIAENLKSLSQIFNKKTDTKQRELTVVHSYTLEVPNTCETDDFDKEVMHFLIAQKDEEIKNLKAKLEEASFNLQPFNLADHSIHRPVDLDNTVFMFEEEKARMEIKVAQLERELLYREKEIDMKDEENNKLGQQTGNLEQENSKMNKKLIGMETELEKSKFEHATLLDMITGIEKSTGHLLNALNMCFSKIGVEGIEKQSFQDVTDEIDYIVNSLLLKSENAERECLDSGTQTSAIYTPVNTDDLVKTKTDYSQNQPLPLERADSINQSKVLASSRVRKDDLKNMLKDIEKLKGKIYQISEFIEGNTSFVLEEKVDYSSETPMYE